MFWEVFKDFFEGRSTAQVFIFNVSVVYSETLNMEMVCNIEIIIAKQFIHWCRFMKCQPLF